jgi:hypothetical protein
MTAITIGNVTMRPSAVRGSVNKGKARTVLESGRIEIRLNWTMTGSTVRNERSDWTHDSATIDALRDALAHDYAIAFTGGLSGSPHLFVEVPMGAPGVRVQYVVRDRELTGHELAALVRRRA